MVMDADEWVDRVAVATNSDEGIDRVAVVTNSDEGGDQVAAVMDSDEGEDRVAATMVCDDLLNDRVGESAPVGHRGNHPCRRNHCCQMLQ
jgi:hypothetical protein